METIEELKKICQGTIHKDASNVYMRHVCRPLSIRMTRFLLPTTVTADQVSQAMIAAGFLTGFAAFVASGEMAYAYFTAHVPRGLWPIRNGGELAVLYCFVFLYISCRGSGVWGIDKGGARR